MPIIKKDADMDVVQAAKLRLINIFSNGLPVYFSFSAGKDSLVLAHLIEGLIHQKKIDPKQLTVLFVDEEAIFDDVERIAKQWRKRFLMLGARFDWYCLEVKHFNAYNQLTSDESFICWDREKKDVWVRQPPSFAIRDHPLLRPRVDKYQDFLPRITRDGIQIIGSRAYESVQRLIYIATFDRHLSGKNAAFPIYDWRDNDVWLYLLRHNIDFPEVYIRLWQVGVPKRQLRISQFFSVDTAWVLVRLAEIYPDLMERVIRREPNAYLAALYWDSEMFRRRSRTRRELEGRDEKRIDYRAETLKMLSDIERHFDTPQKQHVARQYKKLVLKSHLYMTDKHWRMMYDGLVAGDPKLRTLRSVMMTIYSDVDHRIRAERRQSNE